jgi:hypothetical protein
MKVQYEFKYNICVPSELSAGLRGFNDVVTVIIDSGDAGGNTGEFEEHMRKALLEWYDGGNVTVINEISERE